MPIPLRKEGQGFYLGSALAVVLIAVSAIYLEADWIWWLEILALPLLVLSLVFFRDPERQAQGVKSNDLLSPADGTVMEVKKVVNKKYLKGKAIQVNIFLSIFNVHVQRSPVAGKVEYLDYKKGKFLMAFHRDAEAQNEQNWIGLKCVKNKKILVKQITGAIARRILCFKRRGDKTAQGEHLGLIYFGSQVDLTVPASAKIYVKKGDKVYGGQTIIGKL